MPEFDRRPADDDLEIASKIMDTVQKQVAAYRMSLEKLRNLRAELELDKALEKRVKASPDSMLDVLVERGIPLALEAGMVSEDYRDPEFRPELGIWTWDCCCTACCLTCLITGHGVTPCRNTGQVIAEEAIGEPT